MKMLDVYRLGVMAYDAAFSLQNKLQSMRIKGDFPDTLLLLEHPPTLTLAKGTDRQNILVSTAVLEQKGVAVFPTDRGGSITLHGPGQIVGYPILHLNRWGNDIHRYIRNLEQVVIRSLGAYTLEGRRDDEHVGVWIENEKIAAIGVKVKKWVTKHGFALNVNTDLSYFDLIHPCGISDKGVTSMKKKLNRHLNMDEVAGVVIREFSSVFEVQAHLMPEAETHDLRRL
ncbi:MAG: lipoyl(octanoyl) transferase LipB [Desulfobacterales bacterium]